MDYELILDHHYDRIAQDLDVYEIDDYIKELESKNVLQPRDVRNIFNRSESNEDNITRAKKLLDIFTTRLRSKIPGFITSLKKPYPHLVEDFNESLKRIKSIDELPSTKKHIRRQSVMNKIKEHFKMSTPFVVISGFPGTGKTNIAVEAAMHFALESTVYWVNAGGSAGNQVKVLRTLLSRMKTTKSNPDSLSDPEQLARDLKDLLKIDDVVILDDVSTEVDLSIFQSLPPKFIITTTDLAIMENIDCGEKIVVNTGFSKDESLELISKVVEKDVDSLPACTSYVHRHFQGYPLAVRLIAGQLAHCNENFWDELCQFSNDADTSMPINDRRKSSDGVRISIDSTMQKCIQSLSPQNQSYYKMLAIFKDNVFLTTETLKILWNCSSDTKKVRHILNELEDKSMVLKNFKMSLDTDVYEVHSTILNYLRRLHSEEEIKRMHESFVNNYLNLYSNIADIVDDHYIFYYLVYHIISAGCLERLQSELFNLDYIMAKLVACGPNDLAEDLKLYKDALEKAGVDKQRLDETAEFSGKFGWDIYHTKVKDVQFFLHMPENSLLFKEALEICRKKNLLVLKSNWLTQRVTSKEYPIQSVVKKLFCLEDNEILCEKWDGDEPSVIAVKLGDVKEAFIARGSILCICVKSGNLLYKHNKTAFLKQVGGGRTPDVTRQMNGNSYFRVPSNGKELPALGNVLIAAFSQSGDKVVFASYKEKGVFYVQDEKVRLIPKSDDAPAPTPNLCCFSWGRNSDIVMYATMDKRIYFYQTSSGELITKYEHPTIITDMTPIPNKMQLLVISDTSIKIISWDHDPLTRWSSSANLLTIGKISAKDILDKPSSCLKCLATNRWTVIATSNGCVVKGIGEAFFKVEYGEVVAMDIDDKKNTLTVVTSRSPGSRVERSRITVYNLLELERQPRPYLTDACHHWSLQKGYLLGIIEKNNVVFYIDKQKTFEVEILDPISIDMSLKGDIAVVGDAQKGVHFILPFKKKKSEQAMDIEAADFLKMDSSGKFIVVGGVRSREPTFAIFASRRLKGECKVVSPIFDCFFDEDHSKVHLDADPKVIIITVFKNGIHSVYETATDTFRYDKVEQYTESSYVSCAAYHNQRLIKGIGKSLHVFDLKEPDYHVSKKFEHRITSCCIEPCESSHIQQSHSDLSKLRVAVALATDDRRFKVVVCSKNLNEIFRIHLDYAREEVQQLVFSKSQTILMARCDWLCFWDVSDPPKSSITKIPISTLHPAWKTHPVPLDTKENLVARFKLQPEVLSFLPSEDFGRFAVVHKKGDRRILQVVDFDDSSKMRRKGSSSQLHLDLKPQNGSQ